MMRRPEKYFPAPEKRVPFLAIFATVLTSYKTGTDMSKKNQTVPETDLTSEVMEDITNGVMRENSRDHFQKEITMVSDSGLYRQKNPLRHPFRTIHPQVVLVMQGNAEFNINLVSQKLQKGHLLLLPKRTLFHVCSKSGDFSLKFIDFQLPENSRLQLFLLQMRKKVLDDPDYLRINRYFDLVYDCLHSPTEKRESLEYLIMALLYDADDILSEASPLPTLLQREEQVYSKFMKLLLADYETLPRTVTYYADKLGITANYLSTAVRKVSGNPPMFWINKITVDTAKMLLVKKDFSMSDIARKVGFTEQASFTRFFKKEEGMSPLDYRKKFMGGKPQAE